MTVGEREGSVTRSYDDRSFIVLTETQKVKDKERLLEGASHVSFERQRQGRKKVVSKSINAFKEMEPKIFFDQAVFPSLEFKLT